MVLELMALIWTALAAVAGGLLFEWLKVPAGALLGSMVAVGVLNFTPISSAELPGWLQMGAYIGLGWVVGQGINPEVVRYLADRAGFIALIAIMLLLFGGGLAVLAVRLGIVDPVTAFLATSPGGLSQMAALSASTNANTVLVVTLHTVRVVLVVVLAPLVIRVLPPS